MKFLTVATFKSNKTTVEVEDWLSQVAPVSAKTQDDVVVAPSFVHLSAAHSKISNLKSKIYLAAQDVSPFPPGSYTGAVNAKQLADLDVRYCIVGHSERRKYFHETSSEIGRKVAELVTVGITPILCLEEADVFPQLAALEDTLKDKIIYCYEPSGDIGGTEAASATDIARVVGIIRQSCDFPARVMYGGSVNGDNIKELRTKTSIEGVLVSTASLDADSFIKVLQEE